MSVSGATHDTVGAAVTAGALAAGTLAPQAPRRPPDRRAMGLVDAWKSVSLVHIPRQPPLTWLRRSKPRQGMTAFQQVSKGPLDEGHLEGAHWHHPVWRSGASASKASSSLSRPLPHRPCHRRRTGDRNTRSVCHPITCCNSFCDRVSLTASATMATRMQTKPITTRWASPHAEIMTPEGQITRMASRLER